MKSKITFFSLLLLILLILQYTVIPVSYKGCGPDYILILVVTAAMFAGHKFGAVFGLIAGMFCDFSDGMIFGVKMILYTVIAYLIGALVSKLMMRNILTMYLFFIAAFLITQLAALGLYSLFAHGIGFGELFMNNILPSGLLSLPLVLVIYGMTKLLYYLKDRVS